LAAEERQGRAQIGSRASRRRTATGIGHLREDFHVWRRSAPSAGRVHAPWRLARHVELHHLRLRALGHKASLLVRAAILIHPPLLLLRHLMVVRLVLLRTELAQGTRCQTLLVLLLLRLLLVVMLLLLKLLLLPLLLLLLLRHLLLLMTLLALHGPKRGPRQVGDHLSTLGSVDGELGGIRRQEVLQSLVRLLQIGPRRGGKCHPEHAE